MDRLQAMQIFTRVAETASFSRAARELHLSAAAVTRAVSALEQTLGVTLLLRTTRSVGLTDAGRNYLEDCRRILADLAEAEAAAGGLYAAPSGTLSVTASSLFGPMYVLPIVTSFLDQHPSMRAHTLFVDRVVNLIDEGIDVAVRIGHLPDSRLSAILVGSVRHVIVASPGYFAARGAPREPRDLRAHRIVASTGAWTSTEWRFRDDQRVSVRATLQCNSGEAAIATALSGWGLTRVLHYQVAPALADGRLQVALADHEEAPLPIHVVHPLGRSAPAKVRAFLDLAVARLRGDPRLNPR
ncbi:MAG: LysR family transcriptional regulator [Polyangiales bacterium]